VSSSFIAALEPERCQGCWTCLDRCQMRALCEDGERVGLDPDRCIGCGLRVSTCPSEALRLVRRPGSKTIQLPADFGAALRAIGRNQAH
jgi:MinD superfamily P-loop ATPase